MVWVAERAGGRIVRERCFVQAVIGTRHARATQPLRRKEIVNDRIYRHRVLLDELAQQGDDELRRGVHVVGLCYQLVNSVRRRGELGLAGVSLLTAGGMPIPLQ